jgi:hypothetical protein
MTEARITEIYAQMDQARVPLPPDLPGPGELLEKLREVRRWQDAVISLTTEVMRESAGAKKTIRALQALLTAGVAGDARADLLEAKNRLDDLKGLDQALRVCRNNLKTTESDIRLSSHLIDLQMKLGEVRPPDPKAVPSAIAADTPATAIEGLFAPTPATPVQPANGRGPLPRSAPELSGVVQESAALDFDALFAGLGPKQPQ